MKTSRTMLEIARVGSTSDGPIVVAYSGGKDSSAVLKLVFNAIVRNPDLAKKVTVIYCDTKVENPILDEFVKKTLQALRKEVTSLAPGVKIRILQPALNQRYFVRVVGRGYPPPTSFFRWCTKDLRIRPVQRFVSGLGPRPLVIVGTRQRESAQRDRVLTRAGGASKRGPVIQRQFDGGKETNLYLPIVRYSLEEVWECLAELPLPKCINVHRLAEIYRHGGGECPMIRDSNDQPCASARFGCWIRTVVRRDRSTESLLEAGYEQLKAYYDFRTWISKIRNEFDLRCGKRRNGQIGPGPFKLEARRLLLKRVRSLERRVGRTLITEAEERYIKRLWDADRNSKQYLEMERHAAAPLQYDLKQD